MMILYLLLLAYLCAQTVTDVIFAAFRCEERDHPYALCRNLSYTQSVMTLGSQ